MTLQGPRIRRTARTAALAGALLCAAAPLRAQERRTLLPVAATPGGVTLTLDSASIVRTGDSTFYATAVYRYPHQVAGTGADRREENAELDCAGARRGDLQVVLFRGSAETGRSHEPLVTRWSPVPEAEVPIHHALCAAILGSFATNLPVARELTGLDAMPELANEAEVSRSLPREFPPAERDAGTPGEATVRVLVLPDGSAEPASLHVESATSAAFAAAATRVALGMRFHPGRVHGQPVPAWVTLPVTFDFR